MWFLNYIVQRLGDAKSWFLEAYYEVNEWWSPFNLLAPPLYSLYVAFYWLEQRFTDFNTWLTWASDRIDEIIDERDIWNILSTPIKWASDAWNWVANATLNVWSIIEQWGASFYDFISASVNAAQTWLLNQITDVQNFANNLRAEWDNFLTVTLPNLIGRGELDSLLTSWLTTAFPFYDALASLWGEIQAFFVDPLEWLYNKLDEFFERFW